MKTYDLKSALDVAFGYATEINKFVDDEAPWKIDTESPEGREKLENILFILISRLRKVALMLIPFFPQKMNELLDRVGTPYNV